MREKFVSQNMENFNFVPTLLKTTSQELEQKPFPKKKSWRIFRELGGVIFRSVKHCNCFPSVQARCIIFYQNGVNSLFRLGIKCFFSLSSLYLKNRRVYCTVYSTYFTVLEKLKKYVFLQKLLSFLVAINLEKYVHHGGHMECCGSQ